MLAKLNGRFRVVNDARLRERAQRIEDPRHVFYEAMLSSKTYEDYLSRVGAMIVQPKTTAHAVSGFDELCYCRDRRGWIEDG
jgi:hypothetical protein